MPQQVSFRFSGELAPFADALDAEARRRKIGPHELARDLVIKGLSQDTKPDEQKEDLEALRTQLGQVRNEVTRLRKDVATALQIALTRGMDKKEAEEVVLKLRRMFEA